MIELQSVTRTCIGHTIKYDATHSTPGREGTTLHVDVTLLVDLQGKVTAMMDFGQTDPQESIEAALVKLAEWCSRGALAFKSVDGVKTSVPLTFEKAKG